MSTQNDNTAAKGLPPRSGMRRLINPVAYRHLRGFGITHAADGIVQAAAGVICLSYGATGRAFFLAIAALNLGGGCWYLAIDRFASART